MDITACSCTRSVTAQDVAYKEVERCLALSLFLAPSLTTWHLPLDSPTLCSPTLASTTKPIYQSTFFYLTFSVKTVTAVYPETLGEFTQLNPQSNMSKLILRKYVVKMDGTELRIVPVVGSCINTFATS
jgi:hypothetical protein